MSFFPCSIVPQAPSSTATRSSSSSESSRIPLATFPRSFQIAEGALGHGQQHTGVPCRTERGGQAARRSASRSTSPGYRVTAQIFERVLVFSHSLALPAHPPGGHQPTGGVRQSILETALSRVSFPFARRDHSAGAGQRGQDTVT